MFSDFAGPFLLDAFVVSVCCALLARLARLTFFHPAVTYIMFHVYTVTFRLLALLLGAPTMRIGQSFVDPSEIIRAALGCDLAFIAMTLVWLGITRKGGQRKFARRPQTVRVLLSRPVRVIAWVSIAIGAFSLRYLVFSDNYELMKRREALGTWSTSSWVTITITWAQQGVVLLHYIDGFGPIHTAITIVVFFLTALSASRYVVVVWGIFLCCVYLSRKRLRWPPKWMVVMLAAMTLIWYPLKVIKAAIWSGDSLATVSQKAVSYSVESLDSSSGDTVFLDQMAVTLTQVDRYGSYFYGSTILPILVVPVPRQWWPDKPALNQYQLDISTSDSNVGQMGAIATLAGEGYANFGWFGMVLYPAIIAFLYGKWYARVEDYPHNSIAKFFYLVALSSLVQVFRDGLVSIFMFAVVNSMPMAFVVMAHLGMPQLVRKVRLIPAKWHKAAQPLGRFVLR